MGFGRTNSTIVKAFRIDTSQTNEYGDPIQSIDNEITLNHRVWFEETRNESRQGNTVDQYQKTAIAIGNLETLIKEGDIIEIQEDNLIDEISEPPSSWRIQRLFKPRGFKTGNSVIKRMELELIEES